MNRKSFLKFPLACALSVASTSTSHAAFTLIENFESFADGASIPLFIENNANNTIARVENGTTLGPNGNVVARINDPGGSGGAGYGVTVANGTSGTYAFDIFRDGSASELLMSLGNTSPFSSQRWTGAFSVSTNQNTFYQLSFLFNRTAGALAYTNPVDSSTVSLSSQSVAVFLYNPGTGTHTAIATNSPGELSGGSTPDNVWFSQNSPGLQMLVDNVRLSNSLEVIPEPSAALLGALGALILLRRRRG